MSDGFWLALPAIISAICSGIAMLLAAFVAAMVARGNAAQMVKLREVRDVQHVLSGELKEIHTTTNSMKDQIVLATGVAKHAEGMQAQRVIDLEIERGVSRITKPAINVGAENGGVNPVASEIPVATRAERGE